jgi:hypothetical protein
MNLRFLGPMTALISGTVTSSVYVLVMSIVCVVRLSLLHRHSPDMLFGFQRFSNGIPPVAAYAHVLVVQWPQRRFCPLVGVKEKLHAQVPLSRPRSPKCNPAIGICSPLHPLRSVRQLTSHQTLFSTSGLKFGTAVDGTYRPLRGI